MAQRVQVLGPNGAQVFAVYNDNREMVREYDAGEIGIGDEVIYRGQVCEILYEFTDEDGVKYLELLFKGGLGNTIDFRIM